MSALTPFVTQNFLEDMALVLCVAALATVICQLLRQPLLVGYLMAGMVVGPNVPGVYASVERVHLVADLGVTVLVFSAGLDFKFRRLMQLAPTAGLVALIQIVAMFGLGYLVGFLMGWTPWQCLVTGAMVSISGVVIIAKAFEEVPVESRVRELVFGVVMCEDVIAILRASPTAQTARNTSRRRSSRSAARCASAARNGISRSGGLTEALITAKVENIASRSPQT